MYRWWTRQMQTTTDCDWLVNRYSFQCGSRKRLQTLCERTAELSWLFSAAWSGARKHAQSLLRLVVSAWGGKQRSGLLRAGLHLWGDSSILRYVWICDMGSSVHTWKYAFCSLKRLAFDTFHLPARLFLAGCGVHWPCGERCNTLCCSSPASLNHGVQYILW